MSQIRAAAYRRTADAPWLFEDVAQEGVIAAWRELEASGREDYAVRAARFRMAKVIAGKPLTGEPSHAGRQDAHDSAVGLTVTTADGEAYALAEPVDETARAALEAVDARVSAAGPLGEALAALKPRDREIVFLAFWRGLPWREIARALGTPEGTVSRRWSTTIRPALRARLEGAAA